MARPGIQHGREKNVTGGSSRVDRRGDGLGTGPVGGGAPGGKGSTQGSGNSGGRGPGSSIGSALLGQFLNQAVNSGMSGSGSYGGGSNYTGGKKKSGCLSRIIGIAVVLFIVVFLLKTCGIFGSSESRPSSVNDISLMETGTYEPAAPTTLQQIETTPAPTLQVQQPLAEAQGQREKYTKFKNDGTDTATVMVYMCGSDLESRSGMGTSDMQEMVGSGIGSNVNLLLYTGGASRWKNSIVSARTNQIYKISTQNQTTGLERIQENVGDKAMSDPATLTEFIKFAAKQYPSNRYILVLWDHGAGSASGYAYDEKHPYNGYMSLSGIKKAVEDSGVKFDIIGFDACLMSTLETALMLDDSADYLLASEETEPGTGWYYTNWLKMLSQNPAVDTVKLSTQIIDDFTQASRQVARGSQTTLAVTDLAELSARVPSAFRNFSNDITKMIESDDFATVSKARGSALEFASSERLDQVDVSDFAGRLGTTSGAELSEAIQACVKYNRTSSGYERAKGLSIYFPYRRTGQVDSVTDTYKDIGMDEAYSDCIKKFASLEVTGQVGAGGTGSSYDSLFGSLFGDSYGGMFDLGDIQQYGTGSYGSGSSGYGSQNPMESIFGGGYGSYNDYYGNGYGQSGSMSSELIGQLLGTFLSGRSNVAGLSSENTKFMDAADLEKNAAYVAKNSINKNHVVWTVKNGKKVLAFDEKDWNATGEILLNAFVDDGGGMIDMGLDPVYEWTEENDLIGDYDGTWLSLNGQACAFYFDDEQDNGDKYVIHGHIPALVNEERSEIEVVFSDEVPEGEVIGYRRVYKDEEGAGQVAKVASFEEGDVIDFIADYYTYEGTYMDSYMIGDRVICDGTFVLSNVKVNGAIRANYRICDIYGQYYWTPLM